jgi:hypothetical protein
MTWQSEVTPAEWDEWQKLARKLSKSKKQATNMAAGNTYKNFKSEVAATRGYDFSHPLMKVWSAMHEVEDAGARE